MKEKIFKYQDKEYSRDTKWGTFDGRKIPFRDLEDNHILNLYNFIGRRIKKAEEDIKNMDSGDNKIYKEEYYKELIRPLKVDKLKINEILFQLVLQEIEIRDLDTDLVKNEKSLPFRKDGKWWEWKIGARMPTPIPNSIVFMKGLDEEEDNK